MSKIPYKTETVHHIKYIKPKVFLLQDTGIGTSEYAARTAYDSFDNSKNDIVREMNIDIEYMEPDGDNFYNYRNNLNDVYESDLLSDLAWTYFHHSVLEHAYLTFLIKGISRGVLQELARHRIASYTVRSTRYTMGTVLNAFNAAISCTIDQERFFVELMVKQDMLVIADSMYQGFEWQIVFNKLMYQKSKMSRDEWRKLTIAKKSLEEFDKQTVGIKAFNVLQDGPKKRNVGDAFKHIVTDNWKVDLVMSINIRSFKNFLGLRDSGSAWFQIKWLAEEMKQQTPSKYLKLIVKS